MKILLALLFSVLSNFPTLAQIPAPLAWSAEELRTNCIPAGEAGLRARSPDCTVRQFGKVAEIAGKETWYALYSNFPEPLTEAAKGSALDFPNVLVLFDALRSNDRLTPFRVSNAEGSFYNEFGVPKLFQTVIGSVLYVRGTGAGDGRGQFEYDQYLLWQEDLDLVNLRYQGTVRRDSDCHNCATGGAVDVTLELQGNLFLLKSHSYTPATE